MNKILDQLAGQLFSVANSAKSLPDSEFDSSRFHGKCFFNLKTGPKYLDDSAQTEYFNLLRNFLKVDPFKDHCSMKLLERLVEKTLDEFFAGDNSADRWPPLVSALIHEAKSKVKVWHVYWGIDGILYDAAPLEFGRHLLVKMDHVHLTELNTRYEEMFKKCNTADEAVQRWHATVQEKFAKDLAVDNSAFLRMEIEGDSERVQEVARSVGGSVLHILTYLLQRHLPASQKIRMRFGPYLGPLKQSYPLIAVDNSDANFIQRIIMETYPTTISQDLVNRLGPEGLDLLRTMLKSQSPSEMDRMILRGLGFFYNGIMSVDSVSEFVNYMMILETFLSPSDKEQLSKTICESLALLLEVDVDRRIGLKKYATQLYGTRSQLVHGKRDSVPANYIYDARMISSEILWIAITKMQEWKSQKDLSEHVDRLKFS